MRSHRALELKGLALIVFFAFLVWALTQESDTLQALLVTPVWFAVLGVAYLVVRRSPHHQALREQHREKVRAETAALR